MRLTFACVSRIDAMLKIASRSAEPIRTGRGAISAPQSARSCRYVLRNMIHAQCASQVRSLRWALTVPVPQTGAETLTRSSAAGTHQDTAPPPEMPVIPNFSGSTSSRAWSRSSARTPVHSSTPAGV